MRLVCTFLLLFIFITEGHAQFTQHLVSFRHKGQSPFQISTPSAFLSQRAIDRRVRYQIPIDSLDLPVTPAFLDSLRTIPGLTITSVSKWLNQASIQINDPSLLVQVQSFSFVQSISPIAARRTGIPSSKLRVSMSDTPETSMEGRLQNFYNYGLSNGQVRIHQGDFLHNHGFRGEGVQIAMLDGGFYHYQSLSVFDSARLNNRILGTWDFVSREASVDEDHPHGVQCFSTIASNIPGSFVGTAPEASFYLFRTEDVNSEYPVEEQYWAAGAERADSAGVDICSTSLGYYEFDNPAFNYTYATMNGQQTISARACNIAASRGMIMVNAAGNEGNGAWQYVITPGDADSALTVGAIDTTGAVGGFSSYGPNSDGQVKPDLAAVGVRAVVVNPFSGLPSFSSGTSFACPNMAGITACLWQAYPEVSHRKIQETLKKSAHQYQQPDNRTGYGIPDAKNAFVRLQKEGHQLQTNAVACGLNFELRVKTNPDMQVKLYRKKETDTAFQMITQWSDPGAWGFHNFSFTDNPVLTGGGQVLYRIQMEISTDSTYWLDSLSYTYPPCTISNAPDVQISPNPGDGNFQLQTSSNEAVDVVCQIYSANGQRVYINKFRQSAGTQSTAIDLHHVAAGTYYLTVYYNQKRLVTKTLVIR